MTGFPGETDDEFSETVQFIESLPFTYLHVFTYSERPGTRAADLPQVSWEVRKERTRMLRSVSDRLNRKFRLRLIGKTLSVVTLGERDAISSNYVRVQLSEPAVAQRIQEVTISGLKDEGLAERALLPVLA
jgi:threonylcarbamoyladenosine tRNA methylthiotransferase MtaB